MDSWARFSGNSQTLFCILLILSTIASIVTHIHLRRRQASQCQEGNGMQDSVSRSTKMLASIFLPAKLRASVEGEPHQHRRRHALIYFITGNPGLIEYYVTFFKHLRDQLDSSGFDTSYDIYGRCLLGFCDVDHEPFSKSNPPWDLNGQVEGIWKDVASRRIDGGEKQLPPDGSSTSGSTDDVSYPGRPYDFVILVGHSVGAYITLEIFNRHAKNPGRTPHLNLRHGFLLFPTLTDLHHSAKGSKMSKLIEVPTMRKNAPVYAKSILHLFSYKMLVYIMKHNGGFPTRPAELTAEWLKSRDGVWQGIELGMTELDLIREEKWEESLWEVSEDMDSDYGVAPKFFLFYAKKDHWIADKTRDALIEKRKEHGTRGGRTSISIDETGRIAHAFCVQKKSSIIVADKVFSWLQEIESGQRRSSDH